MHNLLKVTLFRTASIVLGMFVLSGAQGTLEIPTPPKPNDKQRLEMPRVEAGKEDNRLQADLSWGG